VADLVMQFSAYGPRYYEPKDFQREQRPGKKPSEP